MSGVDGELKSPAPPRARRRGIKRGLLAVLLLLVAGLLIGRSKLDGWVRTTLEQQLSEAVDGSVTIGALDLTLWKLDARFRELKLETGVGTDLVLSVRVESGSIRLAWRGLAGLARGRVHLSGLNLDRPQLEVIRQTSDAPQGERGPVRPIDLRIDRLRVRSGLIRVEEREIPLDFQAEGIGLDASWSHRSAVGTAEFRMAVTLPPLTEPLPMTVRSGFRWRASEIELFSFEARGDGIDIELDSRIDWRDGPVIEAAGSIEADVAGLRAIASDELPPLSGRLGADFELVHANGRIQLDGNVRAGDARLGPIHASRIAAAVRYADGRVSLTRIRAECLGGRVSGSLDLELGAVLRFDAALNGLQLRVSELLELAGTDLPLGGRVEASVLVRGEAGRASSWNGSGNFKLRSETDTAAVLHAEGAGDFRITDGLLEIVAPAVAIAAAKLEARATIRLGADSRSEQLELEGSTTSARETQLTTLIILESLGIAVPALVHEPLHGYGRVAAHVGLGGEARLGLQLELQDGDWGGRTFDRTRLDLRLEGDRLTIRQLELTDGDQTLDAAASFTTAPFSVDEARIVAAGVDIGWILGPFDAVLGLDGRISGQLHVTRSPEGLRGSGELQLADGGWSGEKLDSFTTGIVVAQDVVRLVDATLSGPAVNARGNFTLDLRSWEGELELDEVRLRLAELEATGRLELPVVGELTVAGRTRVGAAGLDGRFELQGAGCGIYGQPLGAFDGELELRGDEVLLRLDGPARGWESEARLNFDAERTFRASLTMDETLLRFAEEAETPVHLGLSGRLELAGALARLEELELTAAVSEIRLDLGPHRLTTTRETSLSYRESLLRLGPLELVGRNSTLHSFLEWDRGRDRLEANASGTLDLALLSIVVPELRGSGSARVDLRARGSLSSPELNGTLQVAGGRARWVGFPGTLERIDLRIEVEDNHATLRDFRALLGGGEVRGSGEMRFQALAVDTYEMALDASAVRLSLPDDFEGVYDGRLELVGRGDQAQINGELVLLRGQYDKDFDLPRLLGYGTREYSGGESGPENIGLNVQLTAEDNVWVRNQQAQVESRLDLHFGGTMGRPEITGRVWMLEGGKVDFNAVEYRIRNGSLDFVEIGRLNPYLTLRADTTVKEYEINLQIDGTLDQFEYELTSNPSLSPQDIIALLTTGYTLNNPSGQGAEFTGDLAKNYFAGALTATFQNQLQRILGLDRVRIDPLLIQGEANPTARITLGQEVADNVFVVVSSNVDSTEGQIYKVEWQATPKIRLTAISDEGVLGGDVQYTTRFWWRRPLSPAVEADEPGDTAESPRPIVSEILVEGVPPKEASELLKRIPIEVGSELRHSAVFEGTEALRRHFVQSGRILAAVKATLVETRDGTRTQVVYNVDPGPLTVVVFDGVKKKARRRILRSLEELWAVSLFDEDLYSDSAEVIRAYFRERGFYAVDVRVEVDPGVGEQRMRFTIDRGKPVAVSSVVIDGAESVTDARVRRQMLTRPPTIFSRRPLNPVVLDEDIVAIRNLYYDLGFLDIEIEPPRIRLSVTGDKAEVQLSIHEGAEFKIAAVEFSPDLPLPVDDLRAWSGLSPGQVFSPGGLLEAASALRAKLDEGGRPDARVRPEVEIRRETAEVLIRFEVQPGAMKQVGEVLIVGNQRTKDKVIEREILLKPGDTISRETMLRTQHRLYQRGIFRSVRVNTTPIEGDDPGVERVVVEVEESAPLRLSVGGGYDSEGGLRGTFSLTNENLLGWGKVLSFQGRAGQILRRLALVGKDDRLLGRRYPSLVSLSWESEEFVSFTAHRRTAAFQVARRLSADLNGLMRYNFQRIRIKDLQDRVSQGQNEPLQLGDVGLAILRDTRDDPFRTTRGMNIVIDLRLFAKPFLSEESFLKTVYSVAYFNPLGRGTSLASSVRIGLSEPIRDTQRLPISERFFAGGDSTLRGFARDTVGPKGPNGEPLGGQALFLLNEEFRFPIWSSLKGVLFYDAGNVYRTIGDFDLGDIRNVLGAGLRLETPIGPLRFEYGAKLDPREGESKGEFFVSIGSAF